MTPDQHMTPDQLLHHYDQATFWPDASGLTVPDAYASALATRQLRIARGERPRGYKVGFTNRSLWSRYQVGAPIWGTVWDRSLAFCEGQGEVSLTGTCQPRIEPEAVFGMSATPPVNASFDDLWGCIDWVAPGFEIVQSHLKDWKFTAGDTVADGALHARLLVGTRTPVAQLADDASALERRLVECGLTLRRGGEVIERGTGANVLEGPLHALHYFLNELRECRGAPDLQAGDVVTTGTWTDAWPVAPGEQWTAEFAAPLSQLQIRFS